MKWLRYTWQGLIGMLTIGVVFAALSTAGYGSSGNAEGVIIAGVLLVLLQVSAFQRAWASSMLENGLTVVMELNAIKAKLGLEHDSQEQVEAAQKLKGDIKSKMIVPMIVDFILWVMAVLFLFSSLV